MKSGKQNVTVSIIILVAVLFSPQSIKSQPADVVNKYIQAIYENDWAKAESYWLPSELDKSRRLGISFAGLKAKYDNASPLVYADKRISNDIGEPKIGITYLDSLNARASVTLIIDGQDPVIIPYYTTKTDGQWYLCSSMYVYTGNWVIIPTRYFNVYFTDSSLINELALAKLDSFTDSICNRFGVSGERKSLLEQAKIDYYLCDERQIELLTGHDAQGMTNFQFDAIITRHLPHTHELVHMLYNFAAVDLPLFILPALQEGLACCLGGRWGKTPDVINYWGNVSITLGMAKLDDILTAEGFYRCPGGVDAAYAISSLLAESLIDNFGMDRFRQFCEELSGSAEVINAQTLSDIKSKAEKIFGEPWKEIESRFITSVNEHKYCGIVPGGLTSSAEDVNRICSDNIEMKIRPNENSYTFEIRLAPGCSGGGIVFSDTLAYAGDIYQSRFFNEQFPDKIYKRERYGIRFSEGEAGLYNYNTNMLLAKYVFGFTPDENFWDSEKRVITFSLDKELLDGDMGDYQIDVVEAD